MSLQIWLPLNGDLHNQGLSNINATMMGTGITYSVGKIGQAATFPNNCNSCIYLPRLRLQTGTYAAWIKVIGAGGAARQCIISEGRDSYNDGVEIYANQAGTSLSFKAHEKIITTTISLNQWYHVAGTFGNGEIKLYINGTLIGSNTYTTVMTYQYALDLVLGKMSYSYTNTSNYFPFNGQLNDVRIYDHALSAKEVKEISKGLILHYKLDNSINYSANLLTTTKSSAPKNYNAYQININPNFTAEESYTLQLGGIDISHTGKTADTLGVSVYWGGGYIPLCNWIGTDYITNGKADYLKATFIPHNTHANSANAWINIYNSPPNASGTMNLTIKDWRLTAGNSVPFISDVSGYNNNGDIMGNISFTTDTPRYDNSIIFNNTAGKIRPQNFNSACLTDSYTFAWWQYNTSTGNMAWGFSDGNKANLYQTTTMSWNTGDGNTNQFKTSSNSTLSAATYQNKWTHFCITGDGTTTKLYINGSYAASATTYKPITGNNLWISGWDASTSYTFNGSKLSDFRIYTTPLSAEDILELYNTSATIDNQKNIYARELVEIE